MESQSNMLLQATLLVVVLGGLCFAIGLFLASRMWKYGADRFETVSVENIELRNAIASLNEDLTENGGDCG